MDPTVPDRPSLLLSQYACLEGLNFNLILEFLELRLFQS